MAKRTSGPIGQTASSMGGMHINQWKNSEKYHKSIDMHVAPGIGVGIGSSYTNTYFIYTSYTDTYFMYT